MLVILANISSMLSSAKLTMSTFFTMKKMPQRLMLKNIGPSIEPWVILCLIFFQLLYSCSTLILCTHFERYERIGWHLGNRQSMLQAVKGFEEVSKKCPKHYLILHYITKHLPGQHYHLFFQQCKQSVLSVMKILAPKTMTCN